MPNTNEYLDAEELGYELELCSGYVTIVAIVREAATVEFQNYAHREGFDVESLGQQDGACRISIRGAALDLAIASSSMPGIIGFEAP